MPTCDEGHEEITYAFKQCPLCEVLEDLDIAIEASADSAEAASKVWTSYAKLLKTVKVKAPELLI